MTILLLLLLPLGAWAGTIPGEALGVDLDVPLQDRYLSGEALPLKGAIRDGAKAEGQLLFNFVPRTGGEAMPVFLALQGARFSGYQVFRHDQADTYDLEVYLGGPGETRLGFIGGFEGLEILPGSGPIRLPEDFFPGILLDEGFATQFASGEELLLAGRALDPLVAGGQLLWVFAPLEGGEEKRFYLPLDQEGRFEGHQVFRHEESGQYQLTLYLGGAGDETLAYAGEFGVEVRRGSGEVRIPRGYFSGLVLDDALPTRLPMGLPVLLAGQVEAQVQSLRVEVEGAQTRVVPVGLEGRRFALPLRLGPGEEGPLLLRVVVERLDGRFVLAGEFPVQGVRLPAPDLEVDALALGLGPGQEGSVALFNRGDADLEGLSYQVEGPFLVETGPAALPAGSRAQVRVRLLEEQGGTGTLWIRSSDPDEPLISLALAGLAAPESPWALRTLAPDPAGGFEVEVGGEDQLLVLYSAAFAEADSGAVYPFAIGAGAAKAQLLPPAQPEARDLWEGELRRQERDLGLRLQGRPLPSPKPRVAEPQLGDRRRFVFPALGQVPQQEVRARLVAISPHALAWVEEGGQGPDQALVEGLLRQFSEEDYDLVGRGFGLPSDVDQDGRVSFLFTSLVDQVGGLAGFYSAASTLPVELGGTGDQQDLMFLSPTAEARGYRSLLVHEFQHLVNFNQHVLVRRGQAESNWLNEGLSHLAEDLVAGYAASGQGEIIASFLQDPSAVGLAGDALMDPRKRGAAYLFVRSLADRLGEGVVLRLVNSGLADRDNLESATGEEFGRLLGAWGAQLYLSGLGVFPHPRFDYASELLRAGQVRGFALPAALEYRGDPLQGSLRPRGLALVHLRGPAKVRGRVAPGAAGLLIPLPAGFEPQVAVPADHVPGVHFTRLLPGRYLAGQEYLVEGQVLAPEYTELLIQYAGRDTVRVFPPLAEGRFSQALRFGAHQAGRYEVEIYLGKGQGLLEWAGSFGPVEVAMPAQVTAVEEAAVLPRELVLGPAYPNPFNAAVLLPLEVPGLDGELELGVYNILGQQVRLLFRGRLAPGPQALVWDGLDDQGRPAASGAYLFRASWEGQVRVRRGVLLR
jgi:hypothetical protein